MKRLITSSSIFYKRPNFGELNHQLQIDVVSLVEGSTVMLSIVNELSEEKIHNQIDSITCWIPFYYISIDFHCGVLYCIVKEAATGSSSEVS